MWNDRDLLLPESLEGKAPVDILRDVFGHNGFRGQQGEIISRVISGEDTVVLMPTGGGKSICYQVPAIARKGIAIVVSPLISLMQDQVSALLENGVAAGRLGSDMSSEEQYRVVRGIKDKKVKILYVSPERFVSESFINMMANMTISMFAIDEAHCVSQWGHNFRPEYIEIGNIISGFSGIPRIAVTATASPAVRKDMLEHLYMKDAKVFVSSFDRPNIKYEITEDINAEKQLLNFIEDHRGETGVVYCLSRKKTEKIAKFLKDHGYDAFHYHGQVNNEERAKALEKFRKDDAVIAVATNAFGMGIDRPDVRFVAHMDIPNSLEAYYQETGRAGRDGEYSEAWMIYSAQSIVLRRQMIDNNENSSEEHKKLDHGRLQSFIDFVESPVCRRQVILNYFGEDRHGNCNNCDRCLKPVATINRLEANEIAKEFIRMVMRANQNVGINKIIERLVEQSGTKSAINVNDKSHDWWWKSIGRQLSASGHIGVQTVKGQDPGVIYSKVFITTKGFSVLRGEENVRLIEPAPPKIISRRKNTKKNTTIANEQSVPKERIGLYNDLKDFRKNVALRQNIPAYAVMGDITLHSIVKSMPDTLSQLGMLPGLGKSKLYKYGEAILKIVSKYKPKPTQGVIKIPGFNFYK